MQHCGSSVDTIRGHGRTLARSGRGGDVGVGVWWSGRTTFRGMKHTLTGRQEKTLMKLIVDPKTDKVSRFLPPSLFLLA